MPRLTLLFKAKTIKVFPLDMDSGELGVGSAPDNDIMIDSLAVAPHHASITISQDGAKIRQANPGYGLFINGRKISEHQLSHGDQIAIGKHVLQYADVAPAPQLAVNHFAEEEQEDATVVFSPMAEPPEAGLQIIKGSDIGRIFSLRNPLTRLGFDDASSIMITRRSDGYFLSALASLGTIFINDTPLGELSVLLKPGDVIKLDQQLVQFFCASRS